MQLRPTIIESPFAPGPITVEDVAEQIHRVRQGLSPNSYAGLDEVAKVERATRDIAAARTEKHRAYTAALMRWALLHGYAPFASHALYTLPGVLDDTIKEERRLGIEAGFAWHPFAQFAHIGTNFGLSPGMIEGLRRHLDAAREVVFLERVQRNPDLFHVRPAARAHHAIGEEGMLLVWSGLDSRACSEHGGSWAPPPNQGVLGLRCPPCQDRTLKELR